MKNKAGPTMTPKLKKAQAPYKITHRDDTLCVILPKAKMNVLQSNYQQEHYHGIYEWGRVAKCHPWSILKDYLYWIFQCTSLREDWNSHSTWTIAGLKIMWMGQFEDTVCSPFRLSIHPSIRFAQALLFSLSCFLRLNQHSFKLHFTSHIPFLFFSPLPVAIASALLRLCIPDVHAINSPCPQWGLDMIKAFL